MRLNWLTAAATALVCGAGLSASQDAVPQAQQKPFFLVSTIFKRNGVEKFLEEPREVWELLKSALNSAGIDSENEFSESLQARLNAVIHPREERANTKAKPLHSPVVGNLVVSENTSPGYHNWAAQAIVRRGSRYGELLWAGPRYTHTSNMPLPTGNYDPLKKELRRRAEADDAAMKACVRPAVDDLVKALKYGKFPDPAK